MILPPRSAMSSTFPNPPKLSAPRANNRVRPVRTITIWNASFHTVALMPPWKVHMSMRKKLLQYFCDIEYIFQHFPGRLVNSDCFRPFQSIHWYSQLFQQAIGLYHICLWKAEKIRGIPQKTEKFKCSSTLPNIKYKYIVLFLR